MLNNEFKDKFFDDMVERLRVLKRRRSGMNPPYSKKEVFQKYRICNVYRDADRCSRWFIEHICMNHDRFTFTELDLVWMAGLWHKILNPDAMKYSYYTDTFIKGYGLPTYDEYSWDKLEALRRGYEEYSKGQGDGKAFLHEVCLLGPRGVKGVIDRIHEFAPKVLELIKNHTEPDTLCRSMLGDGKVSFTTYEWYLNLCELCKFGAFEDYGECFNIDEVAFVGPGTEGSLKLIFPDIDFTYKGGTYNYLKFFEYAGILYDMAPEELDKRIKGEELYYNVLTDDFDELFNMDFHQIEFWLCEQRKIWTYEGYLTGGVGKKFLPS